MSSIISATKNLKIGLEKEFGDFTRLKGDLKLKRIAYAALAAFVALSFGCYTPIVCGLAASVLSGRIGIMVGSAGLLTSGITDVALSALSISAGGLIFGLVKAVMGYLILDCVINELKNNSFNS